MAFKDESLHVLQNSQSGSCVFRQVAKTHPSFRELGSPLLVVQRSHRPVVLKQWSMD